VGQPVIRSLSGAETEVSLPGAAATPNGGLLLIAIRGNADLVEQVVRQADWSVLRALAAG
jgi:hypothetical protein